MFGCTKELKRDYDILMLQYADKCKEVENWRSAFNALMEATSNSPVVLDFDNCSVFAIERNIDPKTKQVHTVVGHWVAETATVEGRTISKMEAKEWWFTCSNNVHAKLVEDFNAWKAKK